MVNVCVSDWLIVLLQGSELAGWADGRYSFEGIDLNHNFPDLNNIMWDAQETAADQSKVINHYIPIPEYYTKEDAMVRTCGYSVNNVTIDLVKCSYSHYV